MLKKIVSFMAVLLCALAIKTYVQASTHVHKYSSATCTTPQRCSCGATIGNGLGHNFVGGNCTTRSTCSRCGIAGSYGTSHNFTGGNCSTKSKCSRCGTAGSYGAHNYVSATCTTPQRCTICNATVGNGLGHNYTGATCTTAAKCSRCGATGTGPLGHSYSGGSCTVDAKCTRCSATKSAPGHSYAAATCTSAKKCTVCGTTSGSALGHNYTGGNCSTKSKCSRCGTAGSYGAHNYVSATCTAPQRCTICNVTVGNGLGHNYTGATCTTAAKCSRCGATGSSLGHNMSAPTCTQSAKCSRCSATGAGPLGHSYSGGSCTVDAKCTRCSATRSAPGHSYAAATCTTPQKCTACGTTSGSALGHNYTGGTCSKLSTCSRCGASGSYGAHNYVSATCTAPQRCTICNTTIGNGLGHNFVGATCTTASTCSRCGTTGSSLGHNMSAPTCTEPGKCSRCSLIGPSALGHEWGTETCLTGATCIRCNLQKNAPGHTFLEATCSAPKRCTKCNHTEGNGLGHNFVGATCTTASTCSRCGTAGSALGHNFDTSQATCSTRAPCRRDGCTTLGEYNYSNHEKMLEATCSAPKRCESCNYTIGNGLGHIFDMSKASCTTRVQCSRDGCTTLSGYNSQNHAVIIPASCEAPEHCAANCGYVGIYTLPHTYTGGSCTEPSVCSCGKEGPTLPHDFTYKSGTCSTKSECICGEQGSYNYAIHNFKERCTTPDRCDCGQTRGSQPKGHIFDRAIACTSPVACQRDDCNEIMPVQGHLYLNVTCGQLAECFICNETNIVPHDIVGPTCCQFGGCQRTGCTTGPRLLPTGEHRFTIKGEWIPVGEREKCLKRINRCNCGNTTCSCPTQEEFDVEHNLTSENICIDCGHHLTEIVFAEQTNPQVQVNLVGNELKIHIPMLVFKGDVDVVFPGTNKTYKELIIEGIEMWEQSVVYKGKRYNVTIDYEMYDFEQYEDLLTFQTYLDPQDPFSGTVLYDPHFVLIDLQDKIYKASKVVNSSQWNVDIRPHVIIGKDAPNANLIVKTMAHEFGHVLGLGEAYTNHLTQQVDEDGYLILDPNAFIPGVPNDSIMWGSSRIGNLTVTELDMKMFIEAFIKNRMIQYEGPDRSEFIP